MAAVLVLGLAACSEPDAGSLVVTITLSRVGGFGPTLDHVPQSGVSVEVSNDSGDSWPDKTDTLGEAHFLLPAGGYVVDIGLCPDAPRDVKVVKDEPAEVRFDCLAP